MPRTADDIETYLYRLNRTFDRQDQTFIISTGVDRPRIALHVADPVVVIRVVIGKVPSDEKRQNALFRQMLEFNATDLVHASYGVDSDQIVLSAGEELENVDANELAASLSDIDVALTRHIAKLHELALE
ncbi:MAG: hypothetical protein JRI23_23095 [Deltaproteobacteria bacterium]|jgi:hypothetical protein|nr:hypothetical protein [Deltaproteobacteria bacterium]MBW2534859.1 hypothetical protein [Deltaproteobacteria bacterium]